MKKAFFRIATCVAIGLVGMMTTANATPFTLINGSGAASGNTGAPVGTGPAGGTLLLNFGVGGIVGTNLVMTTDHLFEEDFYIDDGTGVGPIKLTDLPVVGEVITPTTVDVTYSGPGYLVHLGLDLSAPNMLGEWMRIEPLTVLQNFRIWEYTDYDVGGTFSGDTATLLGPGHIRQTDGLDYAEVIVHDPAPDHWEIGAPALQLAILAGLDLGDVNNGPPGGDNAFAYEWIVDFIPGTGDEFVIHKWKKFGQVPEPGTLGLMALAGLGLAAVRMRKRLG